MQKNKQLFYVLRLCIGSHATQPLRKCQPFSGRVCSARPTPRVPPATPPTPPAAPPAPPRSTARNTSPLEPKQSGHEVRRKAIAELIHVPHVRVEAPPRRGDPASQLASPFCRARKWASAFSCGYPSATANSCFTPICTEASSTDCSLAQPRLASAGSAARLPARTLPADRRVPPHRFHQVRHHSHRRFISTSISDQLSRNTPPQLHEPVEVADQKQPGQQHDQENDDKNRYHVPRRYSVFQAS